MNLQKTREKTGLTQAEWWDKVGITQSGGSRYEKGDRPIPKPLEMLLEIAYGTDAQAKRLFADLRGK